MNLHQYNYIRCSLEQWAFDYGSAKIEIDFGYGSLDRVGWTVVVAGHTCVQFASSMMDAVESAERTINNWEDVPKRSEKKE